jgi:hypothetical protein
VDEDVPAIALNQVAIVALAAAPIRINRREEVETSSRCLALDRSGGGPDHLDILGASPALGKMRVRASGGAGQLAH